MRTGKQNCFWLVGFNDSINDQKKPSMTLHSHVALPTLNINEDNSRLSVGYKQNCIWLVTGEAVGGRTTIALRDEVQKTRLTLKWLAFYLTDFMNSQRRDLLDQQDARFLSEFMQAYQKHFVRWDLIWQQKEGLC